jgi:hypothetical protein
MLQKMNRTLAWSAIGGLVLLVSLVLVIRGVKTHDQAPGSTVGPSQQRALPPASAESQEERGSTKSAQRPAPQKTADEANDFWHGLAPREMSAYIRNQLAKHPRHEHLRIVRQFYRSDLDPAMRIELICHLEEGNLSTEEVDFLKTLLKTDPERDVREAILILATFHDPPAMQLLREGRLDRDPEVRDLALELMERYDSKKDS